LHIEGVQGELVGLVTGASTLNNSALSITFKIQDLEPAQALQKERGFGQVILSDSCAYCNVTDPKGLAHVLVVDSY
jgi:hypothetical protein